jgi:hypothetical protein
MKGVNSRRRMNSFGLKPSSFYHRGVQLGWYVTCATFLMTEQNYKRFFDFSIFFKKYFLKCVLPCVTPAARLLRLQSVSDYYDSK